MQQPLPASPVVPSPPVQAQASIAPADIFNVSSMNQQPHSGIPSSAGLHHSRAISPTAACPALPRQNSSLHRSRTESPKAASDVLPRQSSSLRASSVPPVVTSTGSPMSGRPAFVAGSASAHMSSIPVVAAQQLQAAVSRDGAPSSQQAVRLSPGLHRLASFLEANPPHSGSIGMPDFVLTDEAHATMTPLMSSTPALDANPPQSIATVRPDLGTRDQAGTDERMMSLRPSVPALLEPQAAERQCLGSMAPVQDPELLQHQPAAQQQSMPTDGGGSLGPQMQPSPGQTPARGSPRTQTQVASGQIPVTVSLTLQGQSPFAAVPSAVIAS